MANATPRALDPKFKDADPKPENDENLTEADKTGEVSEEDTRNYIVAKDVESGKSVRMPIDEYADWERDQDAKRLAGGF